MNRSEVRIFGVMLWQLAQEGFSWLENCKADMKQHYSIFVFRYQTRKDLYRLSDEQLKDVGLTREQIEEEMAKPFWKE